MHLFVFVLLVNVKCLASSKIQCEASSRDVSIPRLREKVPLPELHVPVATASFV